MNLHLKRVNPYWVNHPLIPTAVAIGAIAAAIGYQWQNRVLEAFGVLVAALAIFVATKPVVSAVLAVMGFFGGLATFFFRMDMLSGAMSLPLKIVATCVFAISYMVLMDAVVLVLAVLYNLFVSVLGLGGIAFEFEEAPGD